MGFHIIGGFADELETVGSIDELNAVLGAITGKLGFDHYALSLETHSRERPAPVVLLHDYPAEWARVYVGFDLAGRDPVRRACDKSFAGFSWDEIDQLVPMTRGDRQMLAVGRECGIGDGFTVPRFLPGMARGSCTFAVKPGRSLPGAILDAAEIAGALALTCALKLGKLADLPDPPRLSDRQRECLLWVARGKTAAEIAIILGISCETVIQHLKLARERYEVHCKQSLVLAALFDGLIGFGDVIQWRT